MYNEPFYIHVDTRSICAKSSNYHGEPSDHKGFPFSLVYQTAARKNNGLLFDPFEYFPYLYHVCLIYILRFLAIKKVDL